MSREGGPCPACGRPVEVEIEQIEVTSWNDGLDPNNRRFIDGRASCPAGCNPADFPYIDRALWNAAVTPEPSRVPPEPVADFSPERMARAIDEAIRHNADILERHRTEEDPFYWGNAMQWHPPQQEAS
jgi:hypothetical protein